jgi:peptidoglycan/LPS O-acetylase OafA/YrhL
MPQKAHRDDRLEALRGLAALVVVGWHAMLAFFPQNSGLFPAFEQSAAWTGSPFFVFLNGTGAVALFFVLSGKVLTKSALAKRDYRTLLRNTVKRYPRLVLPILCSTLISCMLFKSGAYHFEQTAAVTGSPWLLKFAFAYDVPITPNWWDATRQGLFDSLLFGISTYNSSLWTMYYEFTASFIVLAAAGTILFLWQRVSILLCWLFVMILCLALSAYPWFLSFGLGLGLALADAQTKGRIWHFVKAIRYALILCGLYFLGHLQPRGVYTWAAPFDPMFTNSIGACLLIVGVQACRQPSGIASKIARFLGDLSFPIYLIHIPVLCSYICWMFVQLIEFDSTGFRCTMIALTFAAAFAASLPLMALNKYWLQWLNRVTDRLFRNLNPAI